jgi:hypothetical protein
MRGTRLRSEVKFVNQATEPGAAAKPVGREDLASAAFLDRWHQCERRPLIQRSVWTVLVVVERAGRDDVLEMARPTIKIRSRHSQRTLPTQRSACARAIGARTGALITRIPSERKTSSKARVNLLSRSRMRNPA